MPIDLDAVIPEMLSPAEKAQLNGYHRKVYETVSPYLDEERRWLKEATRDRMMGSDHATLFERSKGSGKDRWRGDREINEKLLLIDGHSILNRAFFGLPDLTNGAGLHTNAVYGFLNILFKLLDTEEPDALIVAFDARADFPAQDVRILQGYAEAYGGGAAAAGSHDEADADSHGCAHRGEGRSGGG